MPLVYSKDEVKDYLKLRGFDIENEELVHKFIKDLKKLIKHQNRQRRRVRLGHDPDDTNLDSSAGTQNSSAERHTHTHTHTHSSRVKTVKRSSKHAATGATGSSRRSEEAGVSASDSVLGDDEGSRSGLVEPSETDLNKLKKKHQRLHTRRMGLESDDTNLDSSAGTQNSSAERHTHTHSSPVKTVKRSSKHAATGATGSKGRSEETGVPASDSVLEDDEGSRSGLVEPSETDLNKFKLKKKHQRLHTRRMGLESDDTNLDTSAASESQNSSADPHANMHSREKRSSRPTGASGTGTRASETGTWASETGTRTSGTRTGTSGTGAGSSGAGTRTSGTGTGTSGTGTGTSGTGTGSSGAGTGASGAHSHVKRSSKSTGTGTRVSGTDLKDEEDAENRRPNNTSTSELLYILGEILGDEDENIDAETESTTSRKTITLPPMKIRRDPVALYHYYKKVWDKQKIPGTDRRLKLRWDVRAQTVGTYPCVDGKPVKYLKDPIKRCSCSATTVPRRPLVTRCVIVPKCM